MNCSSLNQTRSGNNFNKNTPTQVSVVQHIWIYWRAVFIVLCLLQTLNSNWNSTKLLKPSRCLTREMIVLVLKGKDGFYVSHTSTKSIIQSVSHLQQILDFTLTINLFFYFAIVFGTPAYQRLFRYVKLVCLYSNLKRDKEAVRTVMNCNTFW